MNVGDALIVLWIPAFAIMAWFSTKSVRDKKFAVGLFTPALTFALTLIIAYAFGQSYADSNDLPIVVIGFLFIFVVALPTFLLELLLLFFLRIKRDEMLHPPPPEKKSHASEYWRRRRLEK